MNIGTGSVTKLLSGLAASGVHLGVIDDRIAYEGPEDVLTPAVLDELRNHKEELLQVLAGKQREGGVLIPLETTAPVHHDPADPLLTDTIAGSSAESQGSLIAADVCAMRLSEFANAGLVVAVRSEVLGEVVVFASDNALLDPGERRTVYRAAELRALTDLASLDPDELRQIHRAKRTFKGTILG